MIFYSSFANADDVSLVVVLLDTNPFFWASATSSGQASSLTFSQFLEHVILFWIVYNIQSQNFKFNLDGCIFRFIMQSIIKLEENIYGLAVYQNNTILFEFLAERVFELGFLSSF
jgi:hypothetical protein